MGLDAFPIRPVSLAIANKYIPGFGGRFRKPTSHDVIRLPSMGLDCMAATAA
jgi:hypothetical protein